MCQITEMEFLLNSSSKNYLWEFYISFLPPTYIHIHNLQWTSNLLKYGQFPDHCQLGHHHLVWILTVPLGCCWLSTFPINLNNFITTGSSRHWINDWEYCQWYYCSLNHSFKQISIFVQQGKCWGECDRSKFGVTGMGAGAMRSRAVPASKVPGSRGK